MHSRLIPFLLTFLTSLTLISYPAYSATTTTHSYDEANRLVHTAYDTGFRLTTIDYTYDAAGNILNVTVTANYLAGDVDGNLIVDLTDVILCLQVTTGRKKEVGLLDRGSNVLNLG